MSAKIIGAVLNLDDRFSNKLKKVNEQISASKKSIAQSQKAIADLTKSLQTRAEIEAITDNAARQRAKLNNTLTKAQITAEKSLISSAKEELEIYKKQTQELKKKNGASSKGSGSIAGGVIKGLVGFSVGSTIVSAIKNVAVTAVESASSLETLRAKLDTVTNSSEKSASVMENAISLAQKSSFTNEEMANAATTLETYGLSSEKYLQTVGDAAAITGRDVGDLAKAFGKAVEGNQWDTFYDYGITRDKINEYAKSIGVGDLFSGTKAKDTAVLADVLSQYMNQTYAGGMEKQAGTLSGLWTTTKGLGTNALAQIMGVSSSGEIQEDGALMEIKNIVQRLRDNVERWTSDGTFKRIGNSVGSIASIVADVFEVTSPLLDAILTVTEKILEVTKESISSFKATQILKEEADDYYNSLGDTWWERLKNNNGGLTMGHYYGAQAERALEIQRETGESLNDIYKKFATGEYSYASGTSSHPGGVALVGENGPELVNLPRGTAVTPAIETQSLLSRGNTFNMTFNVNGTGGRAVAEEVAGYIMEALENV